MTEKIYYADPYLKKCESQVVDVIKEDDKILVVLEKTPFYPEGGGQPSDTGYIDEVKVIYVYEKNDVIYHVVEKELECGNVKCSIDFERRFDFMQQHSGEHLLSGVIHKLYKGNNKGFHLGEDYVTVDIDIYPFTDNMIEEIEKEVNNYVYMNEPFVTYFVDKESLDKVPSRKKIDVQGNIRIVEAKDMDCCPCCGTHVLRTGEIGMVKILKVEKYKGMSRLYLKCGKRAYEDFKLKHKIVDKLSRKFSTDEKSVIKNIDKQFEDIFNFKRELSHLKNKLSKEEALKLMESSKENYIFKSYEDKSFEEIKYIGEALSNENYIFILVSLKDKNILFVNNSNIELSCGKLFKEHIKKYNGKGGGRDEKAQGSFSDIKDLEEFYLFLCEMIKNENSKKRNG
ncbi:alanine--tRNA ligase-related protein [Clostridium sp. MB40-C1]|uniref:alanyl-tRNA editing protein n=1 Tax=Clostridium sp. MB40-C1 TaxID=3070996 RepID=UPI0027E19757|nr:alanine--tRNA ligase-related protein [Clostridium sp. MB40-C1]WMJ81824.1 alanine--tRNA ligase-related protein [Clostridium sp. MB40-C1]